MRAWLFALSACGRLGFDDDTSRGDAASSSYARAVLADAPVAYWRLGETAGMTARDEIGQRDGTFSGEVARIPGVTGDGDVAVQFDGATTRLEIGDVFAFGGTAPYSIELWARRSAIDDQVRWLVERRTTIPSNGWQLYTGIDFTLHSRMSSGTEGGYASGEELVPDRWRHLVATFDGSDSALFIDGGYVGGMAAPPISEGAGLLVFGDTVDGQFFKFDGVLDELAIYDAALPQTRILAHVEAVGD